VVSYGELQLLMSYLPYNLNIDEAAFRRQLVTSVHTVLTRQRDSSLLQLRRNANADTSAIDVSEAFSQWYLCDTVVPLVHECFTFVR